MSTNKYDIAILKAGEIGLEHGQNAAAWWIQDTIGGRVTGDVSETAARILKGLDDGDPEVLDSIPAADLSGEWADGYLPADLMSDVDLDIEDDADVFTDICSAYEGAFHDAVVLAVTEACVNADSD